MSVIVEFDEKQIDLIKALLKGHIEMTTEQWDEFYSVINNMRNTYVDPNIRKVEVGDLLVALRREVDLSVETLAQVNQATSSQPKQDFSSMGKFNL